MTEPRAELDARADPGEVEATAVVGGIPLVVRGLRQLARRGWRAARVVVADPAAARAVEAALARDPVPASLAVDVAIEAGRIAAGGPALSIDARAVYRTVDLPGPDEAVGGDRPEPLVRVRTGGDVPAAERALFAQIRKSVDLDGVISFYVIRPLARVVTRALLPTRIAPNHVTFGALGCALAAALLTASGDLRAAAAAGALYWLGGALDHVDGELARLRLQSSKLGEWLDAMTDELSTYSLLAGLGVGLWRSGAGPLWLWIGCGGAAIGALSVARLYVDLHRLGLPIDTAQFPWFFGTVGNQPAEPRERSPLGLLIYGLSFVVRRDANVTLVALVLLAGWRQVAASLLAVGALVAVSVTVTHYAVMAMRRARTPS
jgi:phosphatidylglycerophosphate synthase